MTLRANDLVEAGLVTPERFDEVRRVAAQFSVALTDEVAALIDPADPADPIAAQFVPSAAELRTAPEEIANPIDEERWSPVPGIVHRHPDRALLKPSLLCPVYCRFCFRREQIGAKGAVLDPAALDRAFAYIRGRPEIWEVILTGGDPFLLAPRRIAVIVDTLAAIQHVQVIRFHTRVPVVDPRRVGAALIKALAAEKAVYVVIHANHPRELTEAARAAVGRLTRAGIHAIVAKCTVAGRQRRYRCAGRFVPAGSSRTRVKPIICIILIWREAAHFRRRDCQGTETDARVARACIRCANRPMASIFPAATVRKPIGPTWLRTGEDGEEWLVEDGLRRLSPLPAAVGLGIGYP